jgi:hypothetical protein
MRAPGPLSDFFDRFFADFFLKFTSPPFRDPRAKKSVEQIYQEQNSRHPLVIQDGEEKDQADDKKPRK